MNSAANNSAPSTANTCYHIHGTLTVERCSSFGCKGCAQHIVDMREMPADEMAALNAITLVW